MARKRRKHSRRRGRSRSPVTTVYATNPRRHKRRRRGYRRNPLAGGLIKATMQGVKDASGVLVGKAATRVVSSYIPFGTNVGVIGAVKQVAVAVGVGYAAGKLVKRGDFARFVTAGGIAGALESLVKSLNIPILSANLGDGSEYSAIPNTSGSAYQGIGAYPGSQPMGAYPLGDFGDGMGELGYMGAM